MMMTFPSTLLKSRQGQLRDEALTTSVARTCRWSLERLDESWECLEIVQGQHVGQSNVHSVDLDVALAQTPCLSIRVGPYHVHVPADVRFPLGAMERKKKVLEFDSEFDFR